jgi:hypothetical protein
MRSVASSVRDELRVQSPAVRAEIDLATIGRGDEPIVVGPWLSEVGFELLYWIPLLNRLVRKRGIEPERLVAVTRGGAGPWYSNLCARSVDVFDFYDPAELRELKEREFALTGSRKQGRVRELDRQVLDRVREHLDLDSVRVLHPRTMYGLFRAVWSRRRPVGLVERRVDFRPLPRPRDGLPPGLPSDYVVVKAYFSEIFPDTPANREWVSRLVTELARRVPVVMLTTRIAVDDHVELDMAEDATRVFDASEHMTPQNNLEVQTRITSGARALFATYGGFSYLGPFVGVPSYSFYSRQQYNPTHMDVMERASRNLHPPGRTAGFTTFHVDDAVTLATLAGEQGATVS